MDLKELTVTGSLARRHPWELARLDVVERLLRRGGIAEARHIVDLGCGDAFVASSLAGRLNAARVSAVDRAFTPDTIARITTQISPRVRLFDSLESLSQQAEEKASLVLLLDVLEHCEDDRATLESVVESPAVAPDAHFLLTVPAFQKLFSKHDTFLGHYRRYERGQLVRLARECGLEPIQNAYFFSSLLAPRSMQVARERLGLGPREVKGLGDHRGAAWSDALIRNVLWADFRVGETLARAGVYLPGLSCFVLARKARA